MSRIGKLPVNIPDNVEVKFDSTQIEIKGPKGALDLKLRPEINLDRQEKLLYINRTADSKIHRSMHGLFRVLINNMIVGVSNGFQKKLEIIGTGYRANVDGKKLVLNIGYSNPYTLDIPEGIKITVDNNTNVIIDGIDKQLVGETAAKIRKMRPPEPYKGKGIKYADEVIKRKAGKASK